jgi:hypothetical protein
VSGNHFWRLTTSRKSSVKEAYECFFLGSIDFVPFQRIWKFWAPSKCQFFIWLAAHNKCWKADRLACHGITHPNKCPLCDQEEETIDHLLISFTFLRQFWFFLWEGQLTGGLTKIWAWSNAIIIGVATKELSSVIILEAGVLWKHMNRCVFDATLPPA